jgi:chemotaxis protein CheZ
MPQAEEVSQITDATERLGYVVKLTEAAANRTMDLVESARRWSTAWLKKPRPEHRLGRFMRREVGAEEFRELARGSTVS